MFSLDHNVYVLIVKFGASAPSYYWAQAPIGITVMILVILNVSENTYKHTYTHKHTHTHIHAHKHTRTSTRIHIHRHIYYRLQFVIYNFINQGRSQDCLKSFFLKFFFSSINQVFSVQKYEFLYVTQFLLIFFQLRGVNPNPLASPLLFA